MFQTYPVLMNANTDVNSEDIADVWDEHLKCEFETHDVEGSNEHYGQRAIRTSCTNINWRNRP